jgi:hypothetical protein
LRAAVLAVCLAACARAAPQAPPGADAGAPASPTASLAHAWLDAGSFAAPPSRPPAEVDLVERGREPRRPLRYAPAAGDRRQYRLAVDTRQTARISDSPDTSVAAVEHVIWLTTTAPVGAGAPWRWELGRIEVPERGAAKAVFDDYFADWQPSQGELGVDPRGRRPVDARPLFAWRSPGPNEILRLHEDLLDVLVPVLPEEPVGAGARWELRDQLVRGGVAVSRTSRFELVGPARLRVHVELQGGPQRAVYIDRNSLVRYDLASWKVEVRGEYAWDGKGLLPDAARLAYRLDFSAIDASDSPSETRDLVHNRVDISASLSR